MNKIKVALVTLGDSRRSFYEKRAHIALRETARACAWLSARYDLYAPDVVFDVGEGLAAADEIRARGIRAVLIHVPIWATPNLALRIAESTSLPVVVLGNRQRDTSSLVTLLAVAGLLDQCGKSCLRISGDQDDPAIRAQIDDYIRACAAADGIRRSSFGMIGGRSIGIGTTVADPSQWQRVFGCEFDHCDQYEIVYRAQALDESRVQRHLNWVLQHMPHIEYGETFTPRHLELQVRSYLALKDMAAEKKYDFMGVKCQQDMSDHFVLQCLGVALLNNTVDADGPKEPIPTSCECDCDGALTMRILSLCAGKSPSCLMDIKFFDGEEKEFILANCGSVAPYFADPQDMDAALGKVTLMPHIFGEAGGASLQMIAKPGAVTAARLFRSNGRYTLCCFEGQTEMRPLEELKKTTWCYPHAFIRADIDYDRVFETINSNHMHLVYGKYAKVLELFCRMVGIDYLCYNR